MLPGKYNITCPQGTTFMRTFTAKIDRRPVNLAGYQTRMQIRPTYDGPLVLEAATALANASTGTVSVTITAAQTSALKAGTYVYDLELEAQNGEVIRLIEGRFVITPEVTR